MFPCVALPAPGCQAGMAFGELRCGDAPVWGCASMSDDGSRTARCLEEGRNLMDAAQCPNVTGVQSNSA